MRSGRPWGVVQGHSSSTVSTPRISAALATQSCAVWNVLKENTFSVDTQELMIDRIKKNTISTSLWEGAKPNP